MSPQPDGVHTNGTTSDTETKPVAPFFPEKPAVAEERNGDISFQVVNNDGKSRSMIILTGLKCIFQKQLPKMPKDYIARLVYDRTHLSMAIVKRPPAGSYAESSGLPGEVVEGSHIDHSRAGSLRRLSSALSVAISRLKGTARIS